MKTKSEHTKEFILSKVAPIFNKKGYQATSLSDLTEATKLTKGAIYGNFQSKEDLAIKAFLYNVKRILSPLNVLLLNKDNAIDKLYVLTKFYREYYDFSREYGGCPILNVATDTNNLNTRLFQVVTDVSLKLEDTLIQLIQDGIDKFEIKKSINAKIYARNIYAMIEGCIFMAFIRKDKVYITEMMNHIDFIIKEKLIN